MGKRREKRLALAGRRVENRGPLFDWLADLDAHVVALPRAESWLQYPYFVFMRHPQLQPQIPEAKYLAWQVETNADAVKMQLKRQSDKISGHEHGEQILHGLTPGQREQLSALLIDCVSEFAKYLEGITHRKRLIRIAGEAERRQRMLNKHVAKVTAALDKLKNYANGLDDWLGMNHRLFAEKGLNAAEHLRNHQSADEWKHDRALHSEFAAIAGFSPFPEDPAASSTVQLFWFFRSGCGLSQGDSCLRAALVRNAFFSRWAKKIAYNVKHRSLFLQSRGSNAVIQDVRRFRPDQAHTA
jgi:hypothetical protein